MKNKKGLVFVGMGFELIGLILTALYLGKYVDEQYNLKGLSIALFSFIALIIWVYHLVLLTRQFQKNDDRK